MITVDRPSSTSSTSVRPDRSALRPPALYVVGYDGSRPSHRALLLAIELVTGRNGHLEIVYVEHVPMTASWSGEALLAIRDALADTADDLAAEVRALLDDSKLHWHFQCRRGSVAHELEAVAAEMRDDRAGTIPVSVVVGASEHHPHPFAGEVSTRLTHRATFPVLVA